jgi:hypothetical protein
VAYGLSSTLEKQFSASDGKISEFWKKIDKNHDFIEMTQKNNASGSATFRRHFSTDCSINVKATYGADGLYLLFEVTDDQDVAWPNNWVNTEKQDFYYNFDAVQFFIDSRPVSEMFKENNLSMILSTRRAVTTTTKLYQCVMGTDKVEPTGLIRSLPDPWDLSGQYWVFGDAQKYLGMEVEILRTNRLYKAQEWFIPWSELGFKAEPDANAKIAFAPGYNDRDEHEYLEPIFNTSGGTNQNSDNIRWIDGDDPFSQRLYGGGFQTQDRTLKPPYCWGEIELGSMVK